MKRRDFIKTLGCSLAGTGLLGCGDSVDRPRSCKRGLIILGVDGMDPSLLRTYMQAGRTPNLAALAKRGAFVNLATSFPPQSPVAWSDFTIGAGSERHGIYDFVHRDPKRLTLYLSTSRTSDPRTLLSIGDFAFPLSSGQVELLRGGRSFWSVLERHDIPATIVKIPSNFPPEKTDGSQTMAGLGTPDLLGTYGIFTVYTDNPDSVGRDLPSGRVYAVDFGTRQRARSTLEGPPNPLSTHRDPLALPVEIIIDRARPVALLRMGNAEVILQPGEWSQWIPICFDPGPLAGEIRGMVRLYLKTIRPHFLLYVSPINLDPLDSAMPISSPASYARQVAQDIGRFYTQGFPEESKALQAGVLSDDEYLEQAELVYEERFLMLERELARFRGGLLFFYFSSVDQVSHTFWRALDPAAPPDVRKYASVIPDLYARIDGVVGRVMAQAGPNTDIWVMSDHGFGPYRRQVHLNTWLAQKSYLEVGASDATSIGPLSHIDWPRTQAYAVGLNQLFINLEGREQHGAVPASERDLILARINRELRALRDPITGEQVVTSLFQPPRGLHPDRTPDLIIGYNRGYRCSDTSAMGGLGEVVLEDNTNKWSGDHCIDPTRVPAVLLCGRPLHRQSPAMIDLAPTILAYFGIEPPSEMEGRALVPLAT